MLKIEDVLKTKGDTIWSVTSKDTVFRALEILADKDIGALLVIDEGKMVGIVTERDYSRKVILKGKFSKETTVGEVMTTIVFSMGPEKSIEECMALMTNTRIRHVPVIASGKLIGMVSMGDVVNAIIKKQKVEIDDLKNYVTSSGYRSEWTSS